MRKHINIGPPMIGRRWCGPTSLPSRLERFSQGSCVEDQGREVFQRVSCPIIQKWEDVGDGLGGTFVGSSTSNFVVIPQGPNKPVDFFEIVYNEELLGFLGQTSNAFLMENEAPIHRAQVAKAWREKQLLKTFKWPAQSPDLNPIEDVRSLLKHAVHVRRIRHRTPTDMTTALNEEWKNVSKGYLDKQIGRASCRERVL